MEILVAPDKFRGTLASSEVAEAIARGARMAFPAATITLRPVADGGEGTVDALLMAAGGRVAEVSVAGPLGGSSLASVARLNDGRCAVEVAQAAGLGLVRDEDRRALDASSRGVGEAMAAALGQAPRSLCVGVGGTSSTDGGTGAATAVGWRFLDAAGKELPAGGGALRKLARIDADGVDRALLEVDIVAACDVQNPLLGDEGTARVYAPQKGADDGEVAILEEAMTVLAGRIGTDLGLEVAELPGAGAGGGLGAGLVAFFGASLRSGFEVVAEAGHLEELVRAADLVITGEGRLDEQSLQGKAPIGVAELASRSRVRCLAVAGEVLLDVKRLKMYGIKAAGSLIETVGRERSFADPAGSVTETTHALLRGALASEVEGRSPIRHNI